jgi:hypothetical protein
LNHGDAADMAKAENKKQINHGGHGEHGERQRQLHFLVLFLSVLSVSSVVNAFAFRRARRVAVVNNLQFAS